jgi:hypothetical protein
VTLAITTALTMQSDRRFDLDAARDDIERVIDDAIQDVAKALEGAKATRVAHSDMYNREVTGSDGAESWAREASTSLVTSVVEGTKHTLAEALGLTYKRWLTELDNKVRASHRRLEGQSIPLEEKFVTAGGVELDRPGDRTAPIADWINCRCRLLYFRPGAAS